MPMKPEPIKTRCTIDPLFDTKKNNGPFDIHIPNPLTQETFRKSERKEDLRKVSDVDALFEELES